MEKIYVIHIINNELAYKIHKIPWINEKIVIILSLLPFYKGENRGIEKIFSVFCMCSIWRVEWTCTD